MKRHSLKLRTGSLNFSATLRISPRKAKGSNVVQNLQSILLIKKNLKKLSTVFEIFIHMHVRIRNTSRLKWKNCTTTHQLFADEF